MGYRFLSTYILHFSFTTFHGLILTSWNTLIFMLISGCFSFYHNPPQRDRDECSRPFLTPSPDNLSDVKTYCPVFHSLRTFLSAVDSDKLTHSKRKPLPSGLLRESHERNQYTWENITIMFISTLVLKGNKLTFEWRLWELSSKQGVLFRGISGTRAGWYGTGEVRERLQLLSLLHSHFMSPLPTPPGLVPTLWPVHILNHSTESGKNLAWSIVNKILMRDTRAIMYS